jgi:two-component system chemotaxis response regulator CheB
MINTLIVDDSALARDILRDFLEGDGNFNIIGEAVDGEDGIQKILSLNPDLLALYIEMPKKTGLEVIEEVMKTSSVPSVVISSHDTAKNAYEATLKGALEFYSKETFSSSLSPEKQKEIYETLKRISSIKTATRSAMWNGDVASESPAKGEDPTTHYPLPTNHYREIAAVVIASSTGGPKALSRFVSLLPADFPVPMVIVQHNSSGFDKSFAQWLDTFTALNVKIAEEGDLPQPGTVYIAQTDKHLELRKDGQGMSLRYNDDPPENNQKPAADVLFRTAAESLRDSVISVVFTGMGNDGASGTVKIREMGGITLAQDEESSLIYGMPKAAVETGCVDMVRPLDSMAEELVRLVSHAG